MRRGSYRFVATIEVEADGLVAAREACELEISAGRLELEAFERGRWQKGWGWNWRKRSQYRLSGGRLVHAAREVGK